MLDQQLEKKTHRLNPINSYEVVRKTAGVYKRDGSVVTVTGAQRHEYVQYLLARSIEFASVDTCVESILLDRQGRPAGLAVALIADDRIDLFVEAPSSWTDLATSLSEEYEVVLAASDLVAVQVEGPLSWEVAASVLTDRDISDVLLHECLDAELEGEAVRMVRVGTTAEYGYLILAKADNALAVLGERAAAVGGGLIDTTALSRLRLEINHPILPEQTSGCSLFESGLAWLATVTRSDAFMGSDALEKVPPTRRMVAVRFQGVDCPPPGAEVTVDGAKVGSVQVAAPMFGQADGLGLLLLGDPFGVPGIEVGVNGVQGRTVSRPVVTPLSWSREIGTRE